MRGRARFLQRASMANYGLSRSPTLLVLGLIALALGFFIEWRGWWNGLFGLLGLALIAMWMYSTSEPRTLRMTERRLPPDRRREALAVGVERRYMERRLA